MKIIRINSKGFTDIISITDKVESLLNQSEINEGLIHLFVTGSTAGITVIEDDKNLFEDFRQVLETIAPYKKNWQHHETWGDDNGAAHIRASLIGPDITIPFKDKRLLLGAWQKLVFIDFDTQPREREIVATIFPQ